MNNTLIFADKLMDETIAQLKYEGVPNNDHAAYSELLTLKNNNALIGFDAYFGIVTAVNYNDKTDKYVIKHMNGTAKCTDDVAAFMMQHAFNRSMKPMVYANIEKGVVTSVALRYLSEKD